MTRTTTLAAAAAATLVAVTVSACTGDSSTDPTSSSSDTNSSQSDSSSATPVDRSDAVFDAYDGTTVLGSTTGTVNLGVGSGDPEVAGEEVTFEVTGVTASQEATVLHYQLVADERVDFRVRGEFWEQQPSLRVPGSDERMQSVTAALPPHGSDKGLEVCACTAIYTTLTEPQPQEVVYPPLPEGTKKIDVILQELDPVTVPVTR
ncbi:hypothetical protein [Janibacter alittae]|uniref:Lipoprotein n=1 Tax=Janibacter alittae TaxID=3115209 RepID=A0ABZ2MH72_9MICO